MMKLPQWELSHIGLWVTDMDRMREFYTRLLGFKVMDQGELRAAAPASRSSAKTRRTITRSCS
jgi:catechol 2,3-dioxygenase-like lactoylglutathione lyase family enzyme